MRFFLFVGAALLPACAFASHGSDDAGSAVDLSDPPDLPAVHAACSSPTREDRIVPTVPMLSEGAEVGAVSRDGTAVVIGAARESSGARRRGSTATRPTSRRSVPARSTFFAVAPAAGRKRRT